MQSEKSHADGHQLDISGAEHPAQEQSVKRRAGPGHPAEVDKRPQAGARICRTEYRACRESSHDLNMVDLSVPSVGNCRGQQNKKQRRQSFPSLPEHAVICFSKIAPDPDAPANPPESDLS